MAQTHSINKLAHYLYMTFFLVLTVLPAQGDLINISDDQGDGFRQSKLESIALPTRGGGFASVWIDERNGYRDVRLQIFNAAGEAQGPSTQVNTHSWTGYSVPQPRLGVDGKGRLTILWRQGSSDIDAGLYLQRYTATGQPIGTNIPVVTNTSLGTEEFLVIAQNGAGMILYRVNTLVYGQPFGANGLPSGEPIGFESVSFEDWTADYANDGTFWQAWAEFGDTGYRFEGYAQRFAVDGTAMSEPVKLNPTTAEMMDTMHLSLDAAADGTALVGFAEMLLNPVEITFFAQRLNSDGTLASAPVAISEPASTEDVSSDIACLIMDDGLGLVTWSEGYYDSLIKARWVDASGAISSDILELAGPVEVALDHLTIWTTKRNVTYVGLSLAQGSPSVSLGSHTYRCQVGANQASVTPLEIANDDVAGADQLDPATDSNIHGQRIVVFSDWSTGQKQLSYQRFDSLGNPVGGNMSVGIEVGSSPTDAQVALADDGTIGVTWCDRRSGDYEVFLRILSWDGETVLSDTVVDTAPSSYYSAVPSIAVGADRFVVVWEDEAGFDDSIGAQIYSLDGNPIGGQIRVSSSTYDFWQEVPRVSVASDGSSVVVWRDEGDNNALMQRLSPFGVLIGSNQVISTNAPNSSIDAAADVSHDANDNILIAWAPSDWATPWTGDRIFARWYTPTGVADGPITEVTDGVFNTTTVLPSVSIDRSTGQATIAWVDRRDGTPRVYQQLFDATRQKIGLNQAITDYESFELPDHAEVSSEAGVTFVVWADNHVQNRGYSVFGWQVGGNPMTCAGGADINRDQKVDIGDFTELLIQFGQSCHPSACTADIDQSGHVDIYDFSELILAFGNDCND